MALDDFVEPEVMVAVAVTAAVASPPVRRVLRKGLVYGLAGLLTAGDKVAGAARNVASKAQNLASNAAEQARQQGAGAPAEAATS
jgi:hypothetical protein